MPDSSNQSNPFANTSSDAGDTQLDISSDDGEAYDGGESEIPPAGIYPARCVGAERRQSSSNNPMIQFTYMILSPEKYHGVEVMDWIVLSGKMKFKLGVVLRAFGVEAKGKKNVSIDDLVNKKVNIKLKPDVYNGQPTVRVETVMKLEVASGGNDEASSTSIPTEVEDDDIPF